jgi:hypothetical protein
MDFIKGHSQKVKDTPETRRNCLQIVFLIWDFYKEFRELLQQ